MPEESVGLGANSSWWAHQLLVSRRAFYSAGLFLIASKPQPSASLRRFASRREAFAGRVLSLQGNSSPDSVTLHPSRAQSTMQSISHLRGSAVFFRLSSRKSGSSWHTHSYRELDTRPGRSKRAGRTIRSPSRGLRPSCQRNPSVLPAKTIAPHVRCKRVRDD